MEFQSVFCFNFSPNFFEFINMYQAAFTSERNLFFIFFSFSISCNFFNIIAFHSKGISPAIYRYIIGIQNQSGIFLKVSALMFFNFVAKHLPFS